MVTNALPALRAWADQGKDSLKSVTRADVVAVLPDSGTPRVDMLQGLRHILRPLKNRRIIFTDPTARIFCGMPTPTIPLPVEVDALREALHEQEVPRAALAALAIFHALTSGQLRMLKTTDLRDGRLFLPNRTVLLADPVRTRLAAYLGYRNRRWPRTANPHLFVSQTTGCGVEPVSHVWINDVLGMPTNAAPRGPPPPRGRGHRRRPPPYLRLVRTVRRGGPALHRHHRPARPHRAQPPQRGTSTKARGRVGTGRKPPVLRSSPTRTPPRRPGGYFAYCGSRLQ